MTVYITVDYFGAARRDRPPCDGCTPPGGLTSGESSSRGVRQGLVSPIDLLQIDLAVLRVVGASGGMNLCTRCARGDRWHPRPQQESALGVVRAFFGVSCEFGADCAYPGLGWRCGHRRAR